MRLPNKHIIFVLFGLGLATFLLLQGAAHAFASTRQATIFLPNQARRTLAISTGRRPRWPLHIGRPEDNQAFQACATNTTNRSYRGHDQGNSGNHGVNSGYTEDDSSNETNQILMQNPFGDKRINQSFRVCATDSSNLYYAGVRQGNSGNNGYNTGHTEDNSLNEGNQIIG